MVQRTIRTGFLAIVWCLLLTVTYADTPPPRDVTFTVNATSDESDDDTGDGVCATDAGVCTLRAAIQQANATPGPDMIVFALGTGTPVIVTAGMEVTGPVTIDGATGGATRVELMGTPGSSSGLYVEGGPTTIKHLILHSFGGSGIVLTISPTPFGGGGVTLEDTWIGLDQTGTFRGNGAVDLFVEAPGNTIGGPDPAARNVLASAAIAFSGGNLVQNNYIGTDPTGTTPVGLGGGGGFSFFGASDNELIDNVISGNAGNGVSILMDSAENLLEGNFIGTDPTGTLPVPNGGDGIHIVGSAENIITGNVISGNGGDGLELREGAAGTTITDNHIGTNLAGTAALGNGENGVRLHAAPENLIGGADAEEGNVISGNGLHGIYVTAMVPAAPFPNTIEGNVIGTNAAGTAALGNDGYGVVFEETATHFLGGDTGISPPACTGACNLISGNGMGGVGLLRGAGGIIVRGNALGTDATGTAPLPNTGPGINIMGANDDMIEENVIAFNGGPGVRLVEVFNPMVTANRNAILGNAIFENDGLGIDINGDGVTPNNLIITSGPNTLQPYPVLTSVSYDSVTMTTTVNGFLTSEANETYTIEFFANSAPDPTKFGEGEQRVSMMTVTTDADGRADIEDHVISGEVRNLTTTATDAEGNTSEFSRVAGGIIVNDVRDLADIDLADGICDASNEDGDQCTLRAAIQTANANSGERDDIEFGISDEPTIRPTGALPAILDPVTIDGTTQSSNVRCFPDFLPVEIDGSQAGAGVNGLTVAASGSGSVIKGLTINGFAGSGIVLHGDDNRVECNFIGTTTTGMQARSNQTGITISGLRNLIGGMDFATSNVISGNARYGVQLVEGRDNRVEGNIIGPNKNGDAPLTGTPTGNGWDGVFIEPMATNNRIGGMATAPGTPPGNTISNNGVQAPANDRTVGHGVHIEGRDNTVQGNRIGLAHSGTDALPNDGHGIYIFGPTTDNIIGGGPLLGNVIAFNGGDGVRVEAGSTDLSFGHTILSNAIFGNASLGIDLGNLTEDGVTPNDSGDGDTGANDLVNFPVLTNYTRHPDTGDVLLDVTVDALASDGTVEFFANEACDSSGHGEGAVSLGMTPVSTSGGPAMFVHRLSGVPMCHFITATFTAADGSTSEFSQCAFSKAECLDIVEVQFWHQPPQVSAPVETRRTTDGNPVEIRTLVRNRAKSPLDADLRITETQSSRRILPEPESHTFPPDAVTTLLTPWETAGYAWEPTNRPQSDRLIEVLLTDDANQDVLDESNTAVTVKPRPVVLVHGLWSNAGTWDRFKTFFSNERTDWVVGAVGDNRHLQGLAMDTGQLPSLTNAVFGFPFAFSVSHTPTTIADNARQLDRYIEQLRKDEEAHHLDLVVHSMGGLIARHYLDEIMPDPPAGDPHPVVMNLVMLGTPNLGSPCADLYMSILAQPRRFLTGYARRIPFVGSLATSLLNQAGEALERKAATNLYQLTTYYVQGTFNRAIHGQREVPFYIYAGTAFPLTCTSIGIGDGVVARPSAFAEGSPVPGPFFEDKQERSLNHLAMTKSFSAFLYAEDHLDQTPGDFATQAAKGLEGLFFDTYAAEEEPQVIEMGVVPVLPGDPVTVEVDVPTATIFGVTLLGSGTIRSALYDPAGQLVDSVMATPSNADLFRTHYQENPATGTWTVDFSHALASDTLYVPIAAWVYGNTLRLNLDVSTPDGQGRIPVQATLQENGVTVAANDMTARIVPTEDGAAAQDFDLFDDGASGDGAVGDGVFGGTSASLPSATYVVSVWATYEDQLRSASQLVDLTDVVNGTGIDLALSMTADASEDDFLVYTLTVVNHGPDAATGVTLVDPLPENLAFDAATASPGTCEAEEAIVTCLLGDLAVDANATITLTAIPTTSGSVVNTASVSATEADWNPANNTATHQTDVVTGTAIDPAEGEIPTVFALEGNFPNPFNRQTTIRFDIAHTSTVRLRVFNAMGQHVATLADGIYAPGTHKATFDARTLPSGVYVYRMEAGAPGAVPGQRFQAMRAMIRLK